MSALQEISSYPFTPVETDFATYYAKWSLSQSMSIVGLILRIVLIIIYWMAQTVLLVVNFILNLFGLRKDVLTLHTVVRHFMTGEAVPISLKNEDLKTEFMILRKSMIHTFPLFWF
jgi:hypothetical protein